MVKTLNCETFPSSHHTDGKYLCVNKKIGFIILQHRYRAMFGPICVSFGQNILLLDDWCTTIVPRARRPYVWRERAAVIPGFAPIPCVDCAYLKWSICAVINYVSKKTCINYQEGSLCVFANARWLNVDGAYIWEGWMCHEMESKYGFICRGQTMNIL